MNRVGYYVVGITGLLVLITAGTWVGAVNGEVRRRNEIVEAKGNVYARYSGRYDKMISVIDAIESANAQVTGYITLITEARTALATAIASQDDTNIQNEGDNMENSFISLVAFMEDNPATYTTVGLFSDYIAELSASTNTITYAIETFNEAVSSYNTHIEVFPNIIFLSGKTPYVSWEIPTLATTLPTFD